MTLLRDDEYVDEVETLDESVDEAEPEAEARVPARSWRRMVAIVVLVALGVVLVLALFTGPVEGIWYRNRQHQLAADINTPHPRVLPGQAVAVLQVPRLGINAVVIEGDNPERLRGAPGHRIGTVKPGDRGNSVVVGHRNGWGGPFGKLEQVRKGDFIAVQKRDKTTIVFRVRSIARVGGRETALLRNTKDHRLTLVTSRGGRLSNDRLVVTAISGRPAKDASSARLIRAETPSQSVIFNLTLLLALVALGLAVGAPIYLRGRSGTLARVVVVLPLAAAGTLFLLLDLDLLLPPLS